MNAVMMPKAELLVPDFTPDHILFVDFETFYDPDNGYTLRKMSTESYVRDERFEVIGVGVDDGEDQLWMEEPVFREWAKTVDWSRCAVGAHNFAFDGLILSHHYGIVPGFCIDTLSMGRALHGSGNVSLEKLMPKYGLGEKGHEVLQAKGKRRKDFTLEEWIQYGVYCLNDTHGTKGLFYGMTENDQFSESELALIDATMRMFVDPKFVLNEPLLTQYLIDERKRKQELLTRLSDTPKELRSVLMSNEKFAQLLISLGEDPPRKISPTTKKETWAFAKSDPGMQILLEHPEDTIRWVAEARVSTKSTINETRTEKFLKLGAGGRKMPVFLRYYGAHTGRFSGGDGTNWQNLERVDKKKPERGALRRAVEAPDGHSIVVADSAQIEARTTGWLAGHEKLLEEFRTGADIYSNFASVVYQRHVDRKKNPDDFLAGFIAKCSVLGLGFSMGYYTFAATLLRGMLGGPPVQFKAEDADKLQVDVEKFVDGKWGKRRVRQIEKMPSRISMDERIVHCAVANRIVQTYREDNPIVDFWHELEDVIETMESCAEGEQFSFGPGGCLRVERHAIVLPNGMKLLYPGLEHRVALVEDDEDDDGEPTFTKRGYYSYLGAHNQRTKIYGGKICENLAQSIARIIVTDQMLHMQAAYGYRAATMTHDELVYIAPDHEAPRVSYVLLETMKTAPSWAPGLPLAAEGGFSKTYGGAK